MSDHQLRRAVTSHHLDSRVVAGGCGEAFVAREQRGVERFGQRHMTARKC